MNEKNDVSGINKKHLPIICMILLAEIAILAFATWKWGIGHLDSDDSAEMILAELLSRTGGIMTKNWYYSTELRVLNTQIVMSALFRFFSDWKIIRALGTAILLLILSGSYLYFCSSVRLGRKLIYLSPLIVWPFSALYYDFVLFGLYYIPHISIIFLSLGLVLDWRQRWARVRLVALFALSFVAGLGGIRMLVICYIPMLFSVAVSYIPFLKTKNGTDSRSIVRAFTAAVGCIIGYGINTKVLSGIYSFFYQYQISFVFPSKSQMKNLISSVLAFFEVVRQKGTFVDSLTHLLGLLVFAVVVLMIIRLLLNWRSLPQEIQILLLFFILCFSVAVVTVLFTTQYWAKRYMIMPCIGFVVVLAAYFDKFPFSRPLYKAVYGFIIAAELLIGFNQYCSFATTNKHSKMDSAMQAIIESGMEFGFGDWDASDILTEITNGRIHMCKLLSYKEPIPWYWLMEKDFPKYAQNGPIFLLMDNSMLSYHSDKGPVVGDWEEKDLKYLEQGTVFFKDDHYTVWTYDSFEYFEAVTGQSFLENRTK